MPRVSGVNQTIRRIRREWQSEVSQGLRKVGLEALNGVTNMSPVKSGRFRANWMLDIRPSNTIPHDKPPFPQRAAMPIPPASRVKTELWLLNNVAYAKPLERGSSQQAPQGVVRPTLNRLGLRGSFEGE